MKLDVLSGFTYMYFGLHFTSTYSFNKITEVTATKAKKIRMMVLKGVLPLSHINMNTFFNVFDTKVSPIMLYECELWACKRFLGTSPKASYSAVCGDLGRSLLKITVAKRCFKFWLRILRLPDDR